MVEVKIQCERCNNIQIYSPRNENKIPKRPKTICQNCRRWIYIDREYIISLIKKNDQNDQNKEKSLTKKSNLEKLNEELVILKHLDKGFYAQEIARQTPFSPKFLSETILSFKQRGLIKLQDRKYKIPKYYDLTSAGEIFLESLTKKGNFKEKTLKEHENKKEENKHQPNWVLKTRVHKLRIKDHLIQRPSFLTNISQYGKVRGLLIRKVNMQNWNKYIIQLDHSQFNGIDNIEVNTKSIIYNFRKNIEDQYVYSGSSIKTYLQDRITECLKARQFLENKGFVFDPTQQLDFCQKPHFAFESNLEKNDLSNLGKYVNLTLKSPNGIKEVDDSKDLGGETETDSVNEAQSVLDMPNQIQDLKNEISEMKAAISEVVSGIKTLANAIKGPDKGPNQINDNTRGMFQ